MAKLLELMKRNGKDITTPKQGVASTVQMADLLGQMKEQSLQLEPTPFGTVTRDVNENHNNAIVERVEAMQKQLAEQRGIAKSDFNYGVKKGMAKTHFRRAHGI